MNFTSFNQVCHSFCVSRYFNFFFEKMSGGVVMTRFAIGMADLVKTRKMNYAIYTLGKVDGEEKIVCVYAQGRYAVRKSKDDEKKDDEEEESVDALLKDCKVDDEEK